MVFPSPPTALLPTPSPYLLFSADDAYDDEAERVDADDDSWLRVRNASTQLPTKEREREG